MKNLCYLFILALFFQCSPKPAQEISQFPGKPEVPSSIKKTHTELLAQLYQFTLIKDGSTPFALKLEELMVHHFAEEEDFILPTLGLLPSLAKAQLPTETKEVQLLSEKAKDLMDHMSAEHQLITAYIEELKKASTPQNQPVVLAFEKEVMKHAVSEEEVYFPAAILVGDYLKMKANQKP